MDQLDVEVKPEQAAQAAGQRQVVGMAQVGAARAESRGRGAAAGGGAGAAVAGEIGPGNVARFGS